MLRWIHRAGFGRAAFGYWLCTLVGLVRLFVCAGLQGTMCFSRELLYLTQVIFVIINMLETFGGHINVL